MMQTGYDNSSGNVHTESSPGTAVLPLVAIVILNWNGRKFLEQFLPSVTKSTYASKQIIVADNASQDDSLAFLKQHYPQIRIISNPGNEGFARGYNLALKQVEAEYYMLLNSDVEVSPGWLEPMVALLEEDKNIAACQPKILSFHNKQAFEYAGASGGWIDKYGYPFCRGRIFEDCEEDEGQYNTAEPCFWASGAALLVRSAAYREQGGLDEFFFAHQEEIDFCWRLQLAGNKVYVQPAAVVYHVGGGTLPKGNSRKTFLNFRNNLVMLYKNLPRPAVFYMLLFKMMLDVVAAYKMLFGGDAKSFVAVAKAHVHFAKWVFTQQERSLFPAQRVVKAQGIYDGILIWDYFIKKKKRFSEIVGRK